MPVLVTGCAGFIGMHCAERLLARGDEVVGVDDLNPYYAVSLKRDRLARLEGKPGFRFAQFDLAAPGALDALMAKERPAAVLHLAAQAGVRYSLEKSGGHHPGEPRRLRHSARSLPAPAAAPPRLRLELERLRRQRAPALG